ncbi:MAG TPA: site-specific DNA-methyltransferase [Smithellaceae bacterium]|nr:site-specific DNA-methyltransferase [Smithella sp.]HPL97170.1 site-specific DNA-methyltransferase [Smithellaceae bacterium]
MPKLDWLGKKAVVNHHREVPFHLLKNNDDLSVGDPGSGNLLVQGDNLIALKALLPYYAGQVKCIYIDPPYNTGNENWVYNDNVTSPEMKEWLGRVVGKESEDLSRHDKWLCMMYPRLSLLREFLRDDGAIFVSIDDNEVSHLRMMMDEIFGSSNFMAQLVWKARQHLDSRSLNGISTDHEYIFVYSRTAYGCKLKGKSRDESKYSNPDNDPRGRWMSRSILGLANAKDRPNLHYELVDPTTGLSYPCAVNTGWRYNRETMALKIKEGRIIFPKKPNGRPREKVFLNELQTTSAGFPSIIDGIFTADGSQTIRNIFGTQIFAFPKAPDLVQLIIDQSTDKGSIVLDSFAGSGTTGHAVLAQNAADGGNRRFILVEMENHICRNITTQRLARVSQGYKDVPALGGGFRYCELGEPLFDERGNIRATVSFADLARHVYFTETGEPLPAMKEIKSPLLGVHNDTAVYLLYNGILKDKSVKGGNVLTTNILAALPVHEGNKVIYGTACRMDADRLRREGIVFKQLPYKLKVGVV